MGIALRLKSRQRPFLGIAKPKAPAAGRRREAGH
jgi:hypothetical protein